MMGKKESAQKSGGHPVESEPWRSPKRVGNREADPASRSPWPPAAKIGAVTGVPKMGSRVVWPSSRLQLNVPDAQRSGDREDDGDGERRTDLGDVSGVTWSPNRINGLEESP